MGRVISITASSLAWGRGIAGDMGMGGAAIALRVRAGDGMSADMVDAGMPADVAAQPIADVQADL
jgi:hypothetical protein